MLDYKATQCIRQPPIFLGKNSGFKPLPVYKTTPLMAEGAPHDWLMVSDSITADAQYEGLVWLFLPLLEYVVTMAKFTVFVLHNSRCF